MLQLYSVTDENFYNQLGGESLQHFKVIKEIADSGFTPCVKITRPGFKSSWYNKHLGKTYIIHKIMIDTNSNFINFLVKSNDDGTKIGYKEKFAAYPLIGKGFDIVHAGVCEIMAAVCI